MKSRHKFALLFFLTAFIFASILSCSKQKHDIIGKWEINKEKSTDIDPWRDLKLDISGDDSVLSITKTWRMGRFVDERTERIVLGGAENVIPVKGPKWPDNLHLAVFLQPNATKNVTAKWLKVGQELKVNSQVDLQTTQDHVTVTTESIYQVSPSGKELTLRMHRSSRSKEIVYVFTRK